MSLNYSFTGKKVLVTGGARGIGLAIAEKFYGDGAVLFVIDKRQDLLEELKKKMPNATTVCQDLLQWDASRKAIEALGPLDHLVNNAGIVLPNLLSDISESEFDVHFGVNVKATVNCSAAFLNGIKGAQESGGSDVNAGRTIVNISSIADRLPLPCSGLYCGTKAAVSMLTKVMAIEFSSYKIRVNAVCPGFITTDLLKEVDPKVIEACAAKFFPRLLISEEIEPSDVANAVLILSSPLTSKTTGETFTTDSGIAFQ